MLTSISANILVIIVIIPYRYRVFHLRKCAFCTTPVICFKEQNCSASNRFISCQSFMQCGSQIGRTHLYRCAYPSTEHKTPEALFPFLLCFTYLKDRVLSFIGLLPKLPPHNWAWARVKPVARTSFLGSCMHGRRASSQIIIDCPPRHVTRKLHLCGVTRTQTNWRCRFHKLWFNLLHHDTGATVSLL